LSLFKKNNPLDLPFNKQEILESLTNLLALDYADWKVLELNGFPVDLLLIKSIEVQEKTTINKNPFSEFSKVEPTIYQRVIGIDVKGPFEEVKEDLDISYFSRYIIVDSIKPVIRLLKEYK